MAHPAGARIGSLLGSFEIIGSIGAGGMGDVYRARDRKLQREVAIKALPPEFAVDAERIARFEREAQLLAALHHPNIAGIHELLEHAGSRYLVLELVDGETLAERIQAGRLALDEVVPIARQIADALEAAHDQGIVHRDLKPANIKVRPDGAVKVLDFGLAKAIDTAVRRHSDEGLATRTSPAMTAAGVVLGTAAYMSPEQARGKPVDRRADIWAFGCVLYEMLTGTVVFAGETVSDTLGAILRDEPDWQRLPAGTPASLRKLIARCLQKDPRQRLPHIGAARFELEEASVIEPVAPSPDGPPARTNRFSWWIAALLALTTAGLAAALWREPRLDQPASASMILLPENSLVTPPNRFALSPDGRRLAFVAPDVNGRNNPSGDDQFLGFRCGDS